MWNLCGDMCNGGHTGGQSRIPEGTTPTDAPKLEISSAIFGLVAIIIGLVQLFLFQ